MKLTLELAPLILILSLNYRESKEKYLAPWFVCFLIDKKYPNTDYIVL